MSNVVDSLKDLMPYIIAAIVIVCLTVLRATETITIEDFLRIFLLVLGYIFGETTGFIRFRRMRLLLQEMRE